MKKLLIAFGLGIACIGAPTPNQAQEKPKLERRVERLVNRLRSNNDDLRKSAEEDIAELGKGAEKYLKQARDAAKKAGEADLAKRLGKFLPAEKAAPAEPKKIEKKAAPRNGALPPPLPKVKKVSYSTLKFALWENGTSTKFERDADGKFKVTQKEGKGAAKIQEFKDEAEMKDLAPDLYKIFDENMPRRSRAKKVEDVPSESPDEEQDPLRDFFKGLEKILPKGEGSDFLKESLEKMRKVQEDFKRSQEDGRSPDFGDLFKDLPGGNPFKDFGDKLPEGSPFKNFEDIFKEFKRMKGPGEGGKLPKSKKPDDEEEHY